MDQLYLSETPILFRNYIHRVKETCLMLNINSISDEWIEEKTNQAFETCLKQDYTYSYLKKGFIGEMGEVFDVIKKYERGDFLTDISAFKNAIVKELGDVLWYSLVLNKWFEENITDRTLFPYYPLVASQNTFTRILCNDIDYFLDAFMVSITSFFRNGAVKPTICCIEYLASLLGMTIDDIQQINYDKLKDRLVRGKIQGSGNNR